MKRLLAAAALFLASVFPAAAQEYYDIDVDLPRYPELQPIPDSPVYYAPNVDSNYFFYDGLYWDYSNDHWYSSTWYNGPWVHVDPIWVPTYLLWVPIRFYRRPPHYFRGWHRDRPPRWGEHWGRDWQARHSANFSGRRVAPPRAPLPTYQRQYNRDNYPRGVQSQVTIQNQYYRHQPHEQVVRQHYESRGAVVQGGGQPQRQERRVEQQREDRRNATPSEGSAPPNRDRSPERQERDRARSNSPG